jgi:hypothetical protein
MVRIARILQEISGKAMDTFFYSSIKTALQLIEHGDAGF